MDQIPTPTPSQIPDTPQLPQLLPEPQPERKKIDRKKILVPLFVVLLLTGATYAGYNVYQSYRLSKQVAALFDFGKTYYDNGNFQKAGNFFERAAQMNPKNLLYQAYLARVLSLKVSEPLIKNAVTARNAALGKPEDIDAVEKAVIEHGEKAIALGLNKSNFPEYTELIHDLATAYRLLDNNDKATEKYLEEINLNPDSSFWARYWVARDYYGRANKPKEALEMMLSALNSKDVDSNHLYRVYFSLGNYYKYFDDDLNAEKYAQFALQSVPQNQLGRDEEIEWIHVLLAELAGRRGNIILADQEIKKANELAGREIYKCDLAKIYLDNNSYDKAINLAENSIDKTTNRICIWTLGMANLKKGNKEEAKKYFDDFLRLAEESKIKSANFFRQIEEVKRKMEGFK